MSKYHIQLSVLLFPRTRAYAEFKLGIAQLRLPCREPYTSVSYLTQSHTHTPYKHKLYTQCQLQHEEQDSGQGSEDAVGSECTYKCRDTAGFNSETAVIVEMNRLPWNEEPEIVDRPLNRKEIVLTLTYFLSS